MKLITELNEEVEYITEKTEDGKKSHYISGIFMQAECKNRNGRWYPKSVLESQLNEFQKKIDNKRSLGELNHPQNPSIGLDRVSHLITDMKFDGNNIIGKAKILETPCGKLVKNLIDEGVGFGVSSRGVGTLKPNSQGINEVQKDFKLSTVDIVSDPSGPECWVSGILEGVEWVYDNSIDSWKVEKLVNETKKKIEESVRSRVLKEQKFKMFEAYMRKLSRI